MKYLEEELDECELIYENARDEFFKQIKQLHHDMNVFDNALDPTFQPVNRQDQCESEIDEIEIDPKSPHPKLSSG